MANSKYAQVSDLLAAGALNWGSDAINAYLVTGGTFDPADKVITDIGVNAPYVTNIQGRYVSGTNFMGEPAVFANVAGDVTYQVVLGKAVYNGPIYLLAWYDTNDLNGPLVVDNTGTLVIRPVTTATIDPGRPLSSRVWMTV